MQTITFSNNEPTKRAMLQLFGKSTDSLGFIIETKSGERVVSPQNQPIHIDNFAGIRPGSEVFITNDLPSLLEQSEYFKD